MLSVENSSLFLWIFSKIVHSQTRLIRCRHKVVFLVSYHLISVRVMALLYCTVQIRTIDRQTVPNGNPLIILFVSFFLKNLNLYICCLCHSKTEIMTAVKDLKVKIRSKSNRISIRSKNGWDWNPISIENENQISHCRCICITSEINELINDCHFNRFSYFRIKTIFAHLLHSRYSSNLKK